MVEGAKGFLGRWARRKTDALQGKPLDEPRVPAKPAPPDGNDVKVASSDPGESVPAAVQPTGNATAAEPPSEEKTLSLDDVKLLTRDSDFKPFMARDVGPEVRNAAMKKLFADPHFNVMDGLDIYIDDYSKSDPIPESMLRQMVGAKFLKLFDDEKKDDAGVQADAAQQKAPDSLPPEHRHALGTDVVAQSAGNMERDLQGAVGAQNPIQSAPSSEAAASQPGSGSGPAIPDAGRGRP
ncbi:MAG: DUF3306 domain-containing protein [Polaromonas sp.]